MSTTRLLILRTSAASGAAVLALAGAAGAASAQTGSLESGVGQGIESVLGPDAGVRPGAGSAEAPGGAQRALPAPFDSPAVAAGSLDPLPSALGPRAATGPDPASLSALEPVSDPGDRGGAGPGGRGGAGTGAGADAGAGTGAGLAAVAALVDVLAGGGSDMVDPAELPPLPAPR